MPRDIWRKRFIVPAFVWSLALGALSGAVVAWVFVAQAVTPQLERMERIFLARPTGATSTVPLVETVKVETRTIAPSLPSAIVSRRRSSVFTMVSRSAVPSKKAEDRLVSSDREAGSAIAVTADGWLVAPASILASVRLSEMGVVMDGRVLPLQKAVRDSATDALYVKIHAQGMPTAAFVHPDDIASGINVWLEPRPRQLYPETVADVRVAAFSDAVSSERSARRFLVTGTDENHWIGAAVWDADGRLVGFTEARIPGGWRVIPAGNVANALASLLTTQEIRHASLGVRFMDLAAVTVDGERESLPLLGALVRNERKTGAAAVMPQGPAAGVLFEGDVIERIERDILDGSADLGERLLAYRPGSIVTLFIRRQGKNMEMKVTLGSNLSSEWLLK